LTWGTDLSVERGTAAHGVLAARYFGTDIDHGLSLLFGLTRWKINPVASDVTEEAIDKHLGFCEATLSQAAQRLWSCLGPEDQKARPEQWSSDVLCSRISSV